MKLEAIIVRLEGVVFDTGEIFRLAANEVLADAGFRHSIGAETFALHFGHYICKERFFEYAATYLHPRRRSDDLQNLIEITYRRIIVTAERAMLAAPPRPRRELAELVDAGRAAGLRFAVVASSKAETAEALIQTTLADVPAFAPSRMRNAWTGTAFERSIDALRAALDGLQVAPAGCFALLSSSYGLAAADAVGVPVAAIIGPTSLNGGIYGARAVVDELPDLAEGLKAAAGEAPGETLLRALRELHGLERKIAKSNGSHVMYVHSILKDKGASVKSVGPADPVQSVAKRLADEKVGAMVILSNSGTLEGIVSERDIVRGLSVHGCDLLGMPVSDIMTRAVITCSPADSLYGVAKVMTNRRIRHLPVSESGKLVGLVSIGDVLSRRLEEVQLEADVLRDYTIALR